MSDYCGARADEYDDWWRGTGLFADRDRSRWAGEVIGSDQSERLLAELREAGCGGGGGGRTNCGGAGNGAGGGAEGGAAFADTWFAAVRVPLR